MPPKKKKKKEIKVEVDDSHTYHINGIKVLFPVKAYPSQISIMNKILHGIGEKKNCLLESPTGSGKSLALLCSCLAWQRTEKERIAMNTNGKGFEVNQKDTVVNTENMLNSAIVKNKITNISGCSKSLIKNETVAVTIEEDVPRNEPVDVAISKNMNEDADDDFVPALKRTRRSVNSSTKRSNNKTPKRNTDNANVNGLVLEIAEEETSKPTWTMERVERFVDEKCEDEINEIPKSDEKVPKIYFGTRTHKQIAQIIRELRKTIYKDVKMSLLGSREYLCIHPTVSKSKEKNDECKSLLKGFEGKSCRYHSNAHLYHGSKNPKHKFKSDSAWDIEDLVTAGKKMKACPYYGSRELAKGAEIIFCPYNYLIDPLIRGQMLIDLKDQIVVLDEAHNIEDSAREAASVSLTMLQLQDAKSNLREMIDLRVMVDSHQKMMVLCDGLLNWMESVEGHLEKRGFENEAKVWTGKEMVKMLKDEPSLRLTPFSFTLYKDELQKLLAEEQENFGSHDDKGPRLNSKSLGCLTSILFTLEKLLDQNHDFASDYRIAFCRTSTMRPVALQLPGGWTKKSNKMEKVWNYKLNLWCLNPAVVFSEIGEIARTVVVTSGTLSPMASFSSELGVSFPISLEASHVIDDSQVWVGNVGVGPSNVVITANYKNSETFSFQDEVGKAVLQICKVIPKGVLCFLPSYSMMEKLMKRWKVTGLWEELSSYKVVQIEPRASERSDFDETLQCYYDCVHASYKSGETSLTGALLFAVCRGKVSEGLDFSDDNARAVIAVGIPFPNVKDVQVELKRKYNTSNVSRGLLNGNDWYEMQAFRAFNQAVGRCIRHKNDWGAIIMLDERFGKSSKYRDGLSKWVRNRFQRYNNFQVCLTSLNEFVQNMLNPDISSKGIREKHAEEIPAVSSSVGVTDRCNIVDVTGTDETCIRVNKPVTKENILKSTVTRVSLEKKNISGDMCITSEEKSINLSSKDAITGKHSPNNSTLIVNEDIQVKTHIHSETNRMSEPCKRKQSTSPVDCGSLQSSSKRFQWKRSPLNGCSVSATNLPHSSRKESTGSRKSLPLSFVVNPTTLKTISCDEKGIHKRASLPCCESSIRKQFLANSSTQDEKSKQLKTTQLATSNSNNKANYTVGLNKNQLTLISSKNPTSKQNSVSLNNSLNDISFDDTDLEVLKTSFITVPKNPTEGRHKTRATSLNSTTEEGLISDKLPLPYNSKEIKTPNRIQTNPVPLSVPFTSETKSTRTPSKSNSIIESQFVLSSDGDEMLDSQFLKGVDCDIGAAILNKCLSPVAIEIGDTQLLDGIDEAEETFDLISEKKNKRLSPVVIEIDAGMDIGDEHLSMISTQLLTTGKENSRSNLRQHRNNTISQKTSSFIYPRSKMTSTPKPSRGAANSNIINNVSKKFNQSKHEVGSRNQSEIDTLELLKPKYFNQSKSKEIRQSISDNLNQSNGSKPTTQSKTALIQPNSVCLNKSIVLKTIQESKLTEISQDKNIRSLSKIISNEAVRRRNPDSPLLLSKSKSLIITPPSPDLFDVSDFNSQDEILCCRTSKKEDQANVAAPTGNDSQTIITTRSHCRNKLKTTGRNTDTIIPDLNNSSNSKRNVNKPVSKNQNERVNTRRTVKNVDKISYNQPESKNQNEKNFQTTKKTNIAKTIEQCKDKDFEHIPAAGKRQLDTRRKRRLGGGSNRSKNIRSSVAKRLLSEEEHDESFVNLCNSGTTAVNECQIQICCHSCTCVLFAGVGKQESLKLPPHEHLVDVLQVGSYHDEDVCITVAHHTKIGETNSTEMFCTNVFYDEVSNTIYQPLYCKKCVKSDGSDTSSVQVGFNLIYFNVKGRQSQTYLFKNGANVV